jgi:hypothetical protein
MSSKKNQANSSNDENGWESISNSSITKSWGGMHNFMLSYGLKPYNHEDYKEAHAIIDAFKQSDWERRQEEENKK